MIDVVVVYDRSAARVIEQLVYSNDSAAALVQRLDRERAFRERGDVEVVLLSARSIDDLKVSHARYFDPRAIRADGMKNVADELLRRAAS